MSNFKERLLLCVLLWMMTSLGASSLGLDPRGKFVETLRKDHSLVAEWIGETYQTTGKTCSVLSIDFSSWANESILERFRLHAAAITREKRSLWHIFGRYLGPKTLDIVAEIIAKKLPKLDSEFQNEIKQGVFYPVQDNNKSFLDSLCFASLIVILFCGTYGGLKWLCTEITALRPEIDRFDRGMEKVRGKVCKLFTRTG